jgi:CRISPR-associated protein Cst2
MSFIAGKLAFEARASAPNMSDADDADRQNVAPVKKLRQGRYVYPYVSAQAYRRWLRDTLEQRFTPSPVQLKGSGKKQQANTAGAPHRYPDDDLFGYMVAVKGSERQRDTVVQTGTLRTVTPTRPTEDFGTMTRGHDEDPIIHSHEFFAGDLAGDLLIDVARIGVFPTAGGERRRNLNEEGIVDAREAGAMEMTFRGAAAMMLPLEHRRERLAALLETMAATTGGANRALHYEDRTPAWLLMAPMKGGVNPFGRVIRADGDSTRIDGEVLAAEVDAWADELDGPVRVGWAPGYHAAQRDAFDRATRQLTDHDQLVVDHPRKILTGLADEVRGGLADGFFGDAATADDGTLVT